MKNVLLKDNFLIQVKYAIFVMKNPMIINIIKMESALKIVGKDMNQLIKMVIFIVIIAKLKINIMYIKGLVKKNVKKML